MEKEICFFIFYFYYVNVHGYNVDTNFPIIFEDPLNNSFNRSSYFGYSVLLSSTWIQIGAPRSNFSTESLDIKEPGVAYHCKFDKPCVQVTLGKSHSRSHFSVSKGSWFGVAMDFQQGVMGNIVVCGHRWMNTSMARLIPGACYLFQPNQDLSNISNIISPTASIDRDKRFLLADTPNVPIKDREIQAYKYALSQSGMSVHYTKSKERHNSLLLGAPGYLNWKGNVVKCNNLAMCIENPTIADTHYNEEIKDFDLFGYQVSSGHFFSQDELLFVAGAPRDSATMKGYIMVFKYPNDNLKLDKILKVSGKTTGEYFGSSIAVADITGDKLDDLIVGAPFFSRNGDEGRIYVLEFHKDKTLKNMVHIEGKKENGRFGTAVASVGDLDHDDREDIAVGAPYEGNGVVYIYYGRSTGLHGPCQRIPAEEVYSGLKGFGISFSGQADIDNHYDDIAVGSFLSGHAVILRTRPVVTVNAYMMPVTHQLQISDSKAVITVCVQYMGTNVPTLNVTCRMSADSSYRRAQPPFIQSTVMLKVDEERCTNYTFTVTFKDIHHNIKFLLSAHVTNISNTIISKQKIFVQKDGKRSGKDHFYDQVPIQKISSGSSEYQLLIPYSQDCKSDVCQPDLQLSCSLLKDGIEFDLSQPFIIGAKANYKLLIHVKNIGEPSYTTNAEVKFSKEIRLANLSYICSEIEETVNCQLGIIRNNSEGIITLDLDMSSVGDLNIIDDQTLYINVSINTTAKDLNTDDNFKQLVVNLSLDVDAHLYGKSQKEIYPVFKFDNGSYATELEAAQIFEIHKKGTSPLKALELILKIPVNITKGKDEFQIVSFYKPDAIIDSKYWYCSVEYGCIDCQSTLLRGIETVESTISTKTQTKRSLLEDNVSKEKFPANRIFYINCSTENVKCTTIRCQSSDLEAYGKVTLRLKVNVAKLGPLLGQKDIVYVTSEGEIILNPIISSVKNIQRKWPHLAAVSSPIMGKIPKKKVESWVIVASVIGGSLIAMVVAMGLAKAGFFQRQTKTDLEELKEKARNSQIQPLGTSNMAADIDANIELRDQSY